MFVYLAIVVALFFAMNIGASGTAAAMGAAYGGGAVRSKLVATLFVGAAALLGAVLGGKEVVGTISKGIVPSFLISAEIAVIILASACLTLFYANLAGIPLSTSEVTVGSVVGVGVAYQSLYFGKILLIVTVWFVLPFAALGIAYLLGKLTPRIEGRLQKIAGSKTRSVLILFLITAGCYEAFSAGMNNVANAVGPLVGAGILDTGTGIWLGGLFVALGAVILGGKVLETNGKKITKLSLLNGSFVSLTSGSLVIVASLFGLPVPLTQATTMAIFGIGMADHGKKLWKNAIVTRIIKIWLVSPLSSLVVSYGLVKLFVLNDYYAVSVIISVFIITVSFFGFKRLRRHEFEGDGI